MPTQQLSSLCNTYTKYYMDLPNQDELQQMPSTSVGISEKLHFPTYGCDWDLELAFLVFTNFGAFIQYLAECKVTNTGTSHHLRQSPNLFQKFQQACRYVLFWKQFGILVVGQNLLCKGINSLHCNTKAKNLMKIFYFLLFP